MPVPSRVRDRHAWYYLRVAQTAVSEKDLSRLEPDLPNLRAAWAWVCWEKKDPELIIAFGEVAWQLFEVIRVRLAETVTELQQIKISGPSAVLLQQALQKLDEIAHAQLHIQAALSSSITASGERSVAGAIIVNSTVITGNNVVIRKEQAKESG